MGEIMRVKESQLLILYRRYKIEPGEKRYFIITRIDGGYVSEHRDLRSALKRFNDLSK